MYVLIPDMVYWINNYPIPEVSFLDWMTFLVMVPLTFAFTLYVLWALLGIDESEND